MTDEPLEALIEKRVRELLDDSLTEECPACHRKPLSANQVALAARLGLTLVGMRNGHPPPGAGSALEAEDE